MKTMNRAALIAATCVFLLPWRLKPRYGPEVLS